MTEVFSLETLLNDVQLLKFQVEQLKDENKKIPHLEAEIVNLKKENEHLKDRLLKYETPKNSNNSSIPPSKDENRPLRKSLREKSGRKTGGQKGHFGTTLQMTDNPDKTEMLVSDFCQCCGNDLRNVTQMFISRRQVVDIPVIKPLYTEYQCYSRKCSCGHEQISDYPSHVTNHIQYGSTVEAAVGYYSVYQYLPYKRMSELFLHFYDLPISEGSIGNMLKRLGQRVQPVYDSIQDAVAKSKTAVGGDESGAKVNGKKFWAWIWQTVMLTYIAVSESRGKKVIDQLFPGGFANAVLVSDRWRSHISTNAKGHQLCLVHLLRELNYLIELEKTAWATNVKTVFKQAIELKRKLPEYDHNDQRVLEIETIFNKLLTETLQKDKTPHTLVFQNSLKDNREFLFTFLYNKDVPPDNNASERGIRNFKVKLKISGQFKTEHNTFAKIRSVIDSCKKNDVPVIEALNLVSQMPIFAVE